MRSFFISLIITLILFFSIDLIAGNQILNYLYSYEIIQSPEQKRKILDKIKKKEKSYRIKNQFFHHTLKPNTKIESDWGGIKYITCTDEYGFRSSCQSIGKKDTKNSIVIIGDSFTEGLGYDYNKTFAGMFDGYKSSKVYNMAVKSYSPIIYYNKIKYYIDNGLSIKHVIVFIDITDIDDEANVYQKCKNNNFVCEKKELSKNFTKDRKIEKVIYFPIFKKLQEEVKNIKRLIKPKNYIYRKNFHRSSWTHIEQNEEINEGIKNSLKYMTKLYDYLNKNNITLSVGIYPHPGQILFDKVNSKQVSIWREFCKLKCKYFIDLFPIFFEDKGKIDDMKIIKKFFIRNDIHCSEIGNRKIFDEIKDYEFGAEE